MENNMTAIEWLEQQLKSTYDKEGKLPLAYTLDLVKQAKVMEKEQITEAHRNGAARISLNEYKSGDEYYKETYGDQGE